MTNFIDTHIIEYEKTKYGSLKMTCSCGKEVICHRWMTSDMWNDTVNKFKEHTHTGHDKICQRKGAR